MRLLIVGSGRMGIRHLIGALDSNIINSIDLFDINQTALDNAKTQLKENARNNIVNYIKGDSVSKLDNHCDIAIVSSTANKREEILEKVISLGAKHVLVEKPLGQSLEEVMNLFNFCNNYPEVKFNVNLNMRLYPGFIKLKYDLDTSVQNLGLKTISVNTGSVGIGANGIHYLDLLFFLFGANRYELCYAEIDETILPSGRGVDFADFGGIAVVKFFDSEEYLGRSMMSISSKSTVLGGWEIVAPHARITIDELKSLRINHYRDPLSNLPINRYAAEYLPFVEEFFEAPSLSSITSVWLNEIFNKNDVLPSVEDSLLAHELMFEWLEKSNNYSTVFPIT